VRKYQQSIKRGVSAMTTALIEQKLASIPQEYLDEVAVFLDFLSYRIQKSEAQNIKRVPGIMKGEVYMSDDFDAPLDDFKENFLSN